MSTARSTARPPSSATNVLGTVTLLEAATRYWKALDEAGRAAFRFHHISTDEVFGSLGAEGAFTETTAYDPRSPYSASKAASDHFVNAWHHTYGLPTIITNCSNNYGPFQFPEKLIPLTIINALGGPADPGLRHGHERARLAPCRRPRRRACWRPSARARRAQTYCIGGNSQRANIDVVAHHLPHPRRGGARTAASARATG